jgi:hypothetical protein
MKVVIIGITLAAVIAGSLIVTTRQGKQLAQVYQQAADSETERAANCSVGQVCVPAYRFSRASDIAKAGTE